MSTLPIPMGVTWSPQAWVDPPPPDAIYHLRDSCRSARKHENMSHLGDAKTYYENNKIGNMLKYCRSLATQLQLSNWARRSYAIVFNDIIMLARRLQY